LPSALCKANSGPALTGERPSEARCAKAEAEGSGLVRRPSLNRLMKVAIL
jgi:hypothetical protein